MNKFLKIFIIFYLSNIILSEAIYSANWIESKFDPYPIYQEQEKLTEEGLELFNNDNNSKKARDKFEKALKIYQTQLIKYKNLYGESSEKLIDIYIRISSIYGIMERNEEAILNNQNAIKIWEIYPQHKANSRGRFYHNIYVGYQNLGSDYEDNNRTEEAINLYEKILANTKIQNQTSNNYLTLSDDEKKEFSERLIKLYEKNGNLRHSSQIEKIVTSCGVDDEKLGGFYEQNKQYASALKYFTNQLKKARNDNSMGEAVGEAEFNMARILYKMDDKANAKNHLLNAIRSFDEAFDENVLNDFSLGIQDQHFKYFFEPLLLDSLEMSRINLRRKGVLLDRVLEKKAQIARANSDPLGKKILELINKTQKQRIVHQNNCPVAKDEIGYTMEDCDVCGEFNLTISDLENSLVYGLLSSLNSNRKLFLPDNEIGKKYAIKCLKEGRVRRVNEAKIEQVMGLIPCYSVLLDFFQYHDIGDDGRYIRSYGVLILSRDHPPLFVSLHNANEIDASISKLREGIVQNSETVVSNELNGLSKRIWFSIYEKLPPDTKTLIISPEGMLNFLPFATLLVDENRCFLSEKFKILYMGSARDLMCSVSKNSNRQLAVFANPQFDLGKILPVPQQRAMLAPSKLAETRLYFLKHEYEKIRFPQLPGTEVEGKTLTTEAQRAGWTANASFGESATEGALRSLNCPSILHLATHGFYLHSAAKNASDGERGMSVNGLEDGRPAKQPTPLLIDPMLASGVALAGAQSTLEAWGNGKTPDPQNDGILTAEEVGALDLTGTWLVTLSACETGVGEAISGEGVFGLRRAFMIAGAENLLMTLWPVNDASTADFMADFYREALASGDAPGALAEVQREWLVRLRNQKGLLAAVRDAGPFVMATTGRPNRFTQFSKKPDFGFIK